MPWNYEKFDIKIENMDKGRSKSTPGKKNVGKSKMLPFLTLLLILPLFFVSWTGPSFGMAVTKKFIQTIFPTVEHISSKYALELYTGSIDEKPKGLFVDVRSKKEFAVSHIPGALHIERPSKLDRNTKLKLKNNSKIIVYCAAGYRSSEACKALEKQGVLNTINLNGGIIDWANNGNPITSEKVAPHTPTGNWLLKKKFR